MSAADRFPELRHAIDTGSAVAEAVLWAARDGHDAALDCVYELRACQIRLGIAFLGVMDLRVNGPVSVDESPASLLSTAALDGSFLGAARAVEDIRITDVAHALADLAVRYRDRRIPIVAASLGLD